MAIVLSSTQNKNIYADGRNEFQEMNSFVNMLISLGQPKEKTNIGISGDNLNHGIQLAKKYKDSDNMLISNHSNAFNKISKGTQIYYHKDSNSGYNMAVSLSNILRKYNIKSSVRHDCRPFTDYNTGFAELRETPQPAILIEWFFHDNISDCKWWDQNKSNCLKALCELIGINYPKKTDKLLNINDICFECLENSEEWKQKFLSLGENAEKAIQKIYYHNKKL